MPGDLMASGHSYPPAEHQTHDWRLTGRHPLLNEVPDILRVMAARLFPGNLQHRGGVYHPSSSPGRVRELAESRAA